MKRKFEHPAPPASEQASGPKYWRSLDELTAAPGFKAQMAREFPEGASNMDGVDRRQFMKIMAASFALGGIGLAGCRRPEQFVLPYGKSVEGVIQGLPLYFATAMPLRNSAVPLLAETHQGRPTKVEGNPSYAPLGGASSLLTQASVLDLYDPDRATAHTKDGTTLNVAAVNDLLAKLGADYAATGGTGLAFLAGQSSSPTRARLVAALKAKFPAAKTLWTEYEAVTDEPPLAAAQASFGRNVKPLYRLSKAKRIVTIDADILHGESTHLYYAREFSKGRKVVKKDDLMNRLYTVESGFTLTGGMADHRLRLASSHMLAFTAALAGKILGSSDYASMAQGLEFHESERWLTECASDLNGHRGECAVVAGAHLPPQVHAMVFAINASLGNVGKTVDLVEVPAPASTTSISDLAADIKAGAVSTLVILGGNPAYDAPADLDWANVQKLVPNVVHYSYYSDETTAVKSASVTHIAAAHYLESWGDARTENGTIVPVQPMILPLFGGLTDIELLARIIGLETADPYSLVFETITKIAGGDTAKSFEKFLHDGLLEGSEYKAVNPSFSASRARSLFSSTPAFVALSAKNLEVRFVTDKVDDGRFANNGWIQEVPDVITKIAWDNAILISPRLAKELDITPKGSKLQISRVEEADFVIGKESAIIAEITLKGRKIRGPLHIQPGLSNYTLILPIGHGRTKAGRIGTNAGTNVYPLRTTDGLEFATGATITLTSERMQLANTQEHWSMEGRDLIREANLDEVQAEGGVGLAYVKGIGMESHTPPVYGEHGDDLTLAQKASELPRGGGLYKTPTFDGHHQWGMSIDLNTCIGCNACVVACQAENNIPIVGKDQVLRGREMHWLRLDRYYSDGKAEGGAFGGEGNRVLPEDPQVSIQPIACAQCETAPCETVCPVNATVHDEEGINTMAYNRCIGTRYCANNCPYKVRRFNFFDWNERQLDSLYLGPLGPQGMPELVKMVKNPEVTVRMRGVMEKCTYCIQRIQNGKIQHKVKMAKAGRPGDVIVPDGVIKTACQQVCPVDGVTFGNILDPNSEVSKAKSREQDYSLLGYLNIRPRTTFLGKLRNPNPQMPDYTKLPFSRVEYESKNYPPGFNHGDSHGEGHHDEAGEHGKPAHKESGHGHTTINAFKQLGGLS